MDLTHGQCGQSQASSALASVHHNSTSSFSARLVAWQHRSGRHGLPWQNTRDPYRVWLSEIMLQQTQVQTVLGYYDRFLTAFPSVQALAAASVDEVMPYWSGLGYYSRARNLHRAAQSVVERFDGHFPRDPALLVELPGIGPSTANAIAAFCFGAPHSIFDANVQRVMARYWAFEDDLSAAAAVKSLWAKAETLLPQQDLSRTMPAYTQGLMDLGATVCTPKRTQCEVCPVESDCQARKQGRVAELPHKTRKLKRTSTTWYWLIAMHGQRVGLVKRPAKGIWAQLYCFPTFEDEAALLQAWQCMGGSEGELQWQPGWRHVLTHKDLNLVPVLAPASASMKSSFSSLPLAVLDQAVQWVDVAAILQGQWAVPAPLLAWLKQGHVDGCR